MRETSLLSVGVATRSVAGTLKVNDTTTRKDVAALVADGRLVEVSHTVRRLEFPWPADAAVPQMWVNGAVKHGRYEVSGERQPGPAMRQVRFLFTPERLHQMMERIHEETRLKQRQEEARRAQYEVERAAERELFAQHYPVLARLLARLDERVRVPGRQGGVSLYAEKHPASGLLTRVRIEVGAAEFDELEKILRNGLGQEP